MFTPAAVLLLASYIGPDASPVSEIDPNAAPSTYQAGTGIDIDHHDADHELEHSDEGHEGVQTEMTDDDLNQEDKTPEPEKAEEGRMVVPPGLE